MIPVPSVCCYCLGACPLIWATPTLFPPFVLAVDPHQQFSHVGRVNVGFGRLECDLSNRL